jgi:hypothetical protein
MRQATSGENRSNTVKPLSDQELKNLQDQAKRDWSASAALRNEFGEDFAAYVAYKRAMTEGRVRVLGKDRQHA